MNTFLRRYLHHTPHIGKNVWLDPSSVIIGRVTLDDDVSIWPLVVLRGDVNYIRIGARTNIQDGSVLHVTHISEEKKSSGFPLIIGCDVTVGHKATLHGCTLGNRILVGMGSIVLDGAIVNDDVIIGAGSLVPSGKQLVSGYLYLGSPVRQIRPLTESELAELRASALRYVSWKNDYLAANEQC